MATMRDGRLLPSRDPCTEVRCGTKSDKKRKNVELIHTGCGGSLVSLAQKELWGCGEAWAAQSARPGPSPSFSLIAVWGVGCRGGVALERGCFHSFCLHTRTHAPTRAHRSVLYFAVAVSVFVSFSFFSSVCLSVRPVGVCVCVCLLFVVCCVV